MLPRDPRKNLEVFHCIAYTDFSNTFYLYNIQFYSVLHAKKILCTLLPLRSAFFIFCAEYRPKVKEETPGLSIGDVAKKLGEMWNKTSAEEKQPYEKKAAKLKEKYEKVFLYFSNC